MANEKPAKMYGSGGWYQIADEMKIQGFQNQTGLKLIHETEISVDNCCEQKYL